MEINPLNRPKEPIQDSNENEAVQNSLSNKSIWARNDKDGKVDVNDISDVKDIKTDAFGSLYSCVRIWLKSHAGQDWTGELYRKLDNFMKSGTAARFFTHDEQTSITYSEDSVLQTEYDKADSNKDGTVSMQELIAYVDTLDNKSHILKDIAIKLGISNQRLTECNFLKSEVRHALNQIKFCDEMGNKDGIVQLDEVISIVKKNYHNKQILSSTFGLSDGVVTNKQGNIGDCWLLTAQTALARKQPELYKKVIHSYDESEGDLNNDESIIVGENKEPKKGDIVIKFFGCSDIFGGKVPTIIVSRETIMSKRQRMAKAELEATDENDGNDESIRLGKSNDPECIALELAWPELVQCSNDKIKILEEEHDAKLQNYLEYSEPVPMEKPDVQSIKPRMSHRDMYKIWQYMDMSESTVDKQELEYNMLRDNDGDPIEDENGNYTVILTEEQVAYLKNYIENSTPTLLEKPEKITEGGNTSYFNHSRPLIDPKTGEPAVKPKSVFLWFGRHGFSNNDSGSIHGGRSENAIIALTGAGYVHYNEESDIKKQLELFNNKNNSKLYFVSFSENFESKGNKFLARHAYYISKKDGNKYELFESQESNVKRVISKKDLLAHCHDLRISKLQNAHM